MEIGSKMALLKCEKQTDNSGKTFYKTTLLEYVYNSKKKVGGSWEIAKYQAYIMDSTYELEPSNFDLNIDKNKYSFKNISNPDTSIIRVYDFKYEEHGVWNNAGNEQLKDDDGRYRTRPVFYINKIALNDRKYVSNETKIQRLEKQLSEEKEKRKEKEKEFRQIISSLRQELARNSSVNNRLEQIVENKNNLLSEAKNKVKEANKQTMVARRRNTINEMQLEKVNNMLDDAKQEVKNVKRMKKQEIINKAKELTFTFDDI